YGIKALVVERILTASAVGSLQEKYAPLDMVIPNQFFDRTRARAGESTFFGEGIVAHVAFAHPVCGELGDVLEESCKVADVRSHRGGTYICMEGPAFSTVAESNVYRSWGMDVIGMTNLPEAKLAREAEICYATLALSTDYDCWHESEEDVTVDAVLAVVRRNVALAKAVVKGVVARLPAARTCPCATAAAHAIMTDPARVPEATRARVELLFGRYL